MSDKTTPLQPLETGIYAELSVRPLPPGHLLVNIPALVVLLVQTEKTLGQDLTEPQARAIRDQSAVIVMADDGGLLAQKRGYEDIRPEAFWQDWQALKSEWAAGSGA